MYVSKSIFLYGIMKRYSLRCNPYLKNGFDFYMKINVFTFGVTMFISFQGNPSHKSHSEDNVDARSDQTDQTMNNATEILVGTTFPQDTWVSGAYSPGDGDVMTNLSVNMSTLLSNMTTPTPAAAVVKGPADVIRKLCYHYIGPVICAFGMVCNVLNFAVLLQHQLKESPYTYLTGLALTDFGALTLSFIFMVISHKNPGVQFWRIYEAHIFLPLSNVCVTASVFIVVLLTIERFLFVRHPLWAKATCDRASAKVKILLILFISLIHNIPRFMAFYVREYKPGYYIIDSTDFRKSDHFLGISWYYNISIHFMPLIILSAANTYLLYAVMQARIQRETLQIRNNKEAAWHKEQVRLTITLISIICLFIVCIIPSAFADFPVAYFLFGGDKTEMEFRRSDFYLILQYIANLLVWCNLSLNFVLYCAFNEKFRRIMILTARRWLSKLNVRSRGNASVLLLVNFKTDRSITRNNSSQTNSFTFQTKMSNAGQELIKPEKGDNSVNHTTALFNHNDTHDKDTDGYY